MTEPPRLMTLDEVAEVLRCSVKTVHARIAEGKLKAIRGGPGVRTLVHPEDLNAYIDGLRGRDAA